MSWSYLPELEAVFWGRTFWDFKPLEPWRSSLTVGESCSGDSRTSACRSFLSGMTCGHSESIIPNVQPTSSGCGASPEILSCREDFLVRISARAASVAASPETNPDCGGKWRELPMKYDPRTSSWKTAPCSSGAASKSSWLIWPRWGMMRAGVCWALDTSTTPLKETGYGYWGNISCTMAGWMTPGSNPDVLKRATYGAQKQSLVCQMLRRLNLYPTVLLVELLMGWPPTWTASEPLATDRFRQWQRSHGKS